MMQEIRGQKERHTAPLMKTGQAHGQGGLVREAGAGAGAAAAAWGGRKQEEEQQQLGKGPVEGVQ